MTLKLIQLFQEMANHTEPECSSNCRVPHSCCSPEYCDMAEEIAITQGVVLQPLKSHPTLKFMSSVGCSVPPHFRPLCTLHVCCISGYGFKPGDPEWTDKYFKIREQIEEEYSQS